MQWPRVVSVLGMLACAVIGFLVAAAGREDADTFRAVGIAAGLACSFSILGLIPRSWSRLPLIAAAALAGWTAVDAFFGEIDPSLMSPLFDYMAANIVLLILATSAVAITTWERQRMKQVARAD